MRWPRTCDGRSLTGLAVHLVLDVQRWRWKPRAARAFGQPFIGWLCFSLRLSPRYRREE